MFLEYYYGKKAASEYVIGTRKGIENKKPIIGHYNVNKRGSGDMYSKGGNLLHTLIQLVDTDENWRQILRKMNRIFYHQTVATFQIESFLSKEIGIDLTTIFNQYLRDIRIPTLEYQIKNSVLRYLWTNVVEGFKMPLKVFINKNPTLIYPTSKIQSKTLSEKKSTFKIDPNFYVYSKSIK